MEDHDVWTVLRHDRLGEDTESDIILGVASAPAKAAEAILDDIFACGAKAEDYEEENWVNLKKFITDKYIYTVEKLEVDCFE